MMDFFDQQELSKRAPQMWRLPCSFVCASLSALLKHTAAITHAGLGS